MWKCSVDGGTRLLWSRFLSIRVVGHLCYGAGAFVRFDKGGRTLTVKGAFPSSDSIACLFDDVAVPAQQSEDDLKCTAPPLREEGTVCLRVAVNGLDADTACSTLIVRPVSQIISINPSTIVSLASTTIANLVSEGRRGPLCGM